MGLDFAVEVVSYSGPFGSYPYNDRYSVLGKPTTWVDDFLNGKTACSVVYAAWNTDPNENRLVTTLKNGAYITVSFDHKVSDDIGNLYGIDFIVFGNSFFKYNSEDYITPDTDMDQYFLTNPTRINAEPVKVSVAQSSGGPWYSFANGPYGDTAFPTNAFEWDRDANSWAAELNWLKPVNPSLSVSSFNGLSVADAIELYDGSAGGTGFDLKDLNPSDYAALTVDPNTGRKWIKYIKVEYISPNEGEIDGFSDVAGGGDYQHPAGDLNTDGRVDYEDVALFSDYWLTNISSPKDEAVIADIYQDGVINFRDWALIAKNWLKCTLGCE
jgi:hypothetical protein